MREENQNVEHAVPDYMDEQRLEKARRLRSAGVEPYPACVQRQHTSAEAVEVLAEHEQQEAGADAPVVAVAGRLMTERVMGGSTFAHIADGEGRIQLYLRRDRLGEEVYESFKKDFDIGDFLAAQGTMFRTRTGEPTVLVDSIQIVSKSLHPLPDKWHGLTDIEARYRHRYVDLIVNDEARELFQLRSQVVAAVRQYLDSHGFLEVETPVLQPIYGGAAAEPFVTHHNQLHQDLYLRISFELYLKRLIVGGFERVYEIGRDFRNEGVNQTHNPEFTQVEFYEAYADYQDIMRRTEEMVAFVAEQVLGTTKVVYSDHEIDLSPPWERRDLRQAIRETIGLELDDYPTAQELYDAIKEIGGRPEPKVVRGKLIDYIIGTYVEPVLIQPTFLYDYPVDISPLAKRKPGSENWVERFEGFVAGMEICNAFTELNDPEEQLQRFLAQGRAFEAGDQEAHQMDEDFLLALAYGMPPTGGFGMGIDRLVMLLSNRASIREVILFPHLRSRD